MFAGFFFTDYSHITMVETHCKAWLHVFKKKTRFDGTTKSKSPNAWMHWMINKTLLCIMHLNTVKPNITMQTVNHNLFITSTITECENQIPMFFIIVIPSYVNIKITIVNVYFGYSNVNSMLYKSNYMLNIVFYMTHKDLFSKTTFNKNLKKIMFKKYHFSRMILKILNHFLIDRSNEK